MIDLAPYYEKYGKAKVDKAYELLTYKKVNKLPKTTKTEPPILYIFRHGQSEDNLKFIFSGWRQVGLTEKGRTQAQALTDYFADKKIDLLFSSDLKRAYETMEIVISKNKKAAKLEIVQDPRIKERSYGVYEGKSKLDYFFEQGEEKTAYFRRNFYSKAENGESLAEVCRRVAEFCDELVPFMLENKVNVAVSCHGNSIRGFRRYFEGLSPRETAELETPLGQDYLSYAIEY